VTDAIRKGASATGTDFDYLLRTAKRESALDPAAKAPTSSAAGLFQFIEQTWLGVVKNDGPALGLSNAASAIVARGDGTYAVPDAAARQAILKLREEPETASAMAGALTRRNREALTAATGRAPSNGELYLAHVLGARGAGQLITSAQTTPDRPAASDFPEAARANRSIFYARDGRAKSSSEVYAMLTADKAGPASYATGGEVKLAVTDDRPPGLYGLFQTGARQSPVSDAVSRIWKGQGAAKAVQADVKAASFFPRSTALRTTLAEDVASAVSGDEPIVVAASAPAAGSSLPAEAPLPPARPVFDTDRTLARAIGPIVQLRTR
jgi:hypothetical protein